MSKKRTRFNPLQDLSTTERDLLQQESLSESDDSRRAQELETTGEEDPEKNSLTQDLRDLLQERRRREDHEWLIRNGLLRK